MAETPHITVLGGGPAGLAAAAAAGDLGFGVTLFEANDAVGGNCRTLEVDGFRFDSGGPIPVDEVISSLPLTTVAEIRGHLHRLSNLRLVGRCGTFTYGWIHNMIREGRQAVASI